MDLASQKKNASISALYLLWLGLNVLALSGCDLVYENSTGAAGVYILGESNAETKEGTLTFYNPWRKKVTSNIIPNISTHKVFYEKGKIYVAPGKGNYMDIYNALTRQKIERFAFRGQPHGFVHNDSSKGYVSDYINKKIYITNLKKDVVIGELSLTDSPDVMVITPSSLVVVSVVNNRRVRLTPVNHRVDRVEPSKEMECQNFGGVLKDRGNEIWILCNGFAETYGTASWAGKIIVLDNLLLEMKNKINLQKPLFKLPYQFFKSIKGDKIYVFEEKNKLLEFDTDLNALKSSIALELSGTPTSLAIDADAAKFYVTQIPDAYFAGRYGLVTIHNLTGKQAGSFKTGINPIAITIL